MSYTIVDDNGTLQIRASIKDRLEFEEFITKLEQRRENWQKEELISDQRKS